MRHPLWWLLPLLACMAFVFQGTRGIWEPDEGRYSATGINMLESGDWLVPTVDGEHPHLTKPPITYWALGASFGLFGLNEWAARLPGALAFIGTGLLVFGLGRRFCPQRPWLPALIYALSFAPFMGANVVSTDNLLVLFETAAMFAFVEAWHRGGGLDRRWIRVMWLCWGLAFMTKGPPGLLPLIAVIVLLAWQERRSLQQLFDPLGMLGFAIVAFTWFGILVAQEPDRLGYFLGYEVYDRIFTDKHDRNAAWYGSFKVYLPMLLLGPLPWWVLAVTAAGGPRSAWHGAIRRLRSRDREWSLLLAWFLLPLVVFMLARSRLELYVLPLFVPLALAFARILEGWPWLTRRRLTWIGTLTAIALVAIKGTVAHWPSDRDGREMARAVRELVDPSTFEEIAFVGMRPFYGLELYLDRKIEGVDFGEPRYQYSKFVPEHGLCQEVAERENNLYAIKDSRSQMFREALARCAASTVETIGTFPADDHHIMLLRVVPAGAGTASR